MKRGRQGKKGKGGAMSSGFTLVELMVTVAIFIFMTILVVANYGSFNNGTLLTSMSYDVALTLRDAQSYGLNVQGYGSSNTYVYNYPYGIHFSSALGSNNQMILFADSSNNVPNGICDNGGTGVCTPTQTTGDGIITAYTIARGGIVSSLCAGSGPGNACISTTVLDITFKRPDPNAVIVVPVSGSSCTTNASPCAYAEIKVEDAAKTSTRTIIVRSTGEIAVPNQ